MEIQTEVQLLQVTRSVLVLEEPSQCCSLESQPLLLLRLVSQQEQLTVSRFNQATRLESQITRRALQDCVHLYQLRLSRLLLLFQQAM
jgi:hypothetical protein